MATSAIARSENPKDVIGSRKAPMSSVPTPVLMELGAAMLEGSCKYGRHNYRAIGVRASVYYDAIMRHMFAWWEGEDIDPESGIHHTVKAMACLAILRDAERNGKLNDDRPPPCKGGWVAEMNHQTEELLKKFPDPVAPYTHDRRTQPK